MTAAEPFTFIYKPRPQFEAFHQRSQRDALMVCHRRAGKTVACIGDLIVRGIHNNRPNARYAYVAPFRQQAKEIAWTYLKDMTEGMRLEKPRESDLRIVLANGTWITIYGADNPDAMRGLYFDGIILDEFGDMKPSLLGEVILPCLADRQGFLVIIGTPKGRNQFYEKHREALRSSRWFYTMLKASESGILSAEELERLRDTMGDSAYARELECDFDAEVPGTYYAEIMARLEQKGRLVDEGLYDPSRAVHVAADIGLRDSTAWWFWQPRPDGDGINVIDYHEDRGKHPDYYLHMLADKNYEYHELWVPSDARAKTHGTRRSSLEQYRHPHQTALEYRDPELARKWPQGSILPMRLVPKLRKQHGIDAARQILPRCYFDKVRCERGLDALRAYRRQFHEHSQTFSDEPLHDWASDGADGFRYLSLVADRSVGRPVTGPPREFNSLQIGQQAAPTVGYQLDELWKERSNGRRAGILRI